MKKGLFILSALLLLGTFTTNQVALNEGVIDYLNEGQGINLKQIQIGTKEEVSVSKTFVQGCYISGCSCYILPVICHTPPFITEMFCRSRH